MSQVENCESPRKRVGVAPDLVERVHQDFLGPRVVVQHVEHVGVDLAAERLVQLAKRCLVFAADAYEQLFDLVVVHAGGGGAVAVTVTQYNVYARGATSGIILLPHRPGR